MMATQPTANDERPFTGVDMFGQPAKAWTGCDVLMTYVKADGTTCIGRRVDDVLFKPTKDGHWVMVGADVESKQPRSFRVDRIVTLKVLRGPNTPTDEKNGEQLRTEAA